MDSYKAGRTHNHLLAGLAASDIELLRPHLSPVELKRNQVLVEPGEDIHYCWFVESGIVSVIAGSIDGDHTEVGIIGWEGMVDVAVIHDQKRSMLRCVVQSPGTAQRIPVPAMQDALHTSASLRSVLLHYAQSLFTQVAGTTLANASLTVEQRLARWLMMYLDRSASNELTVTHELLSLMLNVRRSSVSVALKLLQNANIINARRGTIVVADRAVLERFAGAGYGPAEKLKSR